MIQKIDQIGQEQLKIVKILELSNQSSSQKNIDVNNQFTELKDFISRINQNTTSTLKDLYQQSNQIMNQISRSES